MDKAFIHKECSDVADLRYLDSSNKFQGLKNFVANSGRIFIWADHAPHDWEGALRNMGVSFHRIRGSLNAVVQFIKEEARHAKRS